MANRKSSRKLTHFGKNIRSRRIKLGYSINTFSAEMGISPARLLKVELHCKDINLSTLVRFSKALGCSLDSLAAK